MELKIIKWYNDMTAKMGFNKFITVAGSSLASGIIVGLVMLNAIPDKPEIIQATVENASTAKQEAKA